MVRLSQKEDINLMDRGFLWKYLLLVVLYKNELEESVMKELVSAASNLVQKCIQVMSKIQMNNKSKRYLVLFFSLH